MDSVVASSMTSDAPPWPGARHGSLLRDQVRSLNRNLPLVVGVVVFLGVVLLAVFRGVVPLPSRIAWGGALLLVCGVRLGVWWHYRRHGGRIETAERDALWFTLGAGASGVVWGMAGVLFFAADLEYQLFVLCVLVGLSSGATLAFTHYLPAFHAFVYPLLVPVTIHMLASGGRIQVGLGVMTIAYIAGATYLARTIHRELMASYLLRNENLNLVDELSVQKEEAVQANRAKSRFLAMASHDLRQPLHALTLYLSQLDDALEQPTHRHLLERVNGSVATLQNLFNALLDISKLEAGTMAPELADFALAPLFERLRNDFAVQAIDGRVTLLIPPTPLAVRSDPLMLEQILRNYLSNALRYTRQGQVTVTTRAEGGKVVIEVADSGVGIAVEEQQHIFDEFYQVAQSGRDRGEGLGLGLAIVARLTRLLGHPLAVNSTPGKGAVFSVSVPAADLDPAPCAAILPELPGMDTSQPVRILVIDDDHVARDAACSLLASWGCEVVGAVGLEEAITRLDGHAPDGIVADYRLGAGRNGLDAIDMLCRLLGERPGMIITGDVAAGRLRALKASGVPWVHKPVPPARLRAFVNHVRRQAALRSS